MSRRRRALVVDVLGEIRRAQRALRRCEQFLAQQERHARRLAERERKEANERERARALEERR